MTISFDKVANRVFQILKGRGYSLKMYQDNGQRAFDPSLEARKFFVEDEGIMVSINKSGENSEIKVYISDDSKLEEIEALLVSLRQTANFFGLLYNVRKYGKKLKPKEFAFLAYKTQREEEKEMTESVKVPKEITRTIDALLLRELTPKQIHEELNKFEFAGVRGPLKFKIDEYIQEEYRNLAEAKDISSFWGTSQSSYQRVGSKQARLVVRHSQPVDEEKFAARSRHISKIFIENADGERIKFPVNFLQGARAMTRHVSMGGNFNDAIGEHIQHISEEFTILRKFKSNAGRKLHEQAMNIIGLVRTRSKEITAEVKGMQGPTSYKKYVENFESKEQSLEEDIVMLEATRIKKIFDSVTEYDGIDEAFVAVARLSRMNEDFDNIAEMLETGNISFTPKRDIRSSTYVNRNSAMVNKLHDLAERATDVKVSGFISRIAEKIINDIPMERVELNLVKGIVGIAEGTSTPVIEALDEFVDWADSYILETVAFSPYLNKPLRSEEEAKKDMKTKKKKDDDSQSRWEKKQEVDEVSPYLNKPRRSEEEARRDIAKDKKKQKGIPATWAARKANRNKNDEEEMDEMKPHWKKGRSRYNKQTKNIKYRKEAGSDEKISDEEVNEKSPKGWEGTVKSMKKHKEIDNPWALAHHMKNKGYKSHKTKSGKTKKEGLDTRSTDSIREEFKQIKTKNLKYRQLEKELYNRSITETTENIIRFQELAGIQKKR